MSLRPCPKASWHKELCMTVSNFPKIGAPATRAISIAENDKVDEAALKELIRAAVTLNMAGKKKK